MGFPVNATVLTCIVTTADDGDFRSTFSAALSQTHPHSLLVVDASANGCLQAFATTHPHALILRARGARTFGSALSEALNDPQIRDLRSDASHLWLLHADSAPHDDALEELLAVAESGASIGVVGPKQVGEDGRLLEVGISATRGGRRLETLARGEIDQGQHDGRTDVLAVGSAGMLVNVCVWDQARGFDSALGPFGDGLEFCRRVRRLGYRVLVAPQARITHHQRSYTSSTRSLRQQRHAALYLQLMAQPLWLLPFFALTMLITQPVRALIHLLMLRPGHAWAELGAWLSVVADSFHLLSRRISGRRSAQVPRSALSPLETPHRAFFQRKQWNTKYRERYAGQELSVEAAHIIRSHRARMWKGLALLILLTTVFSYMLVGSATFVSDASRIVAPGWADLPSSWKDIWQSSWTIPENSANVAHPFYVVVSILVFPLSLVGISATTVLGTLLAVAIPLAGLAGWACASVFTQRVVTRVLAGLLWALQPAFLLSVFNGQLASALIHILLPLALASGARYFGYTSTRSYWGNLRVVNLQTDSRVRWWGLFALIMFLLTSALPGLLIIAVGTLVGAAVVSIGAAQSPTTEQATRPLLFGAFLAALPSTILITPFTCALISNRAWAALFIPAGPTLVASGAPGGGATSWDILAGAPSGLVSSLAAAYQSMGGEHLNGWTLWVAAFALPWCVLILSATIRLLSDLNCVWKGTAHTSAHTIRLVATVGGALFLVAALWWAHQPLLAYQPGWETLIPADQATSQGASTSLPSIFSSQAMTEGDFAAQHRSAAPWVAPFLSLASLSYAIVALTPGHQRPSHRWWHRSVAGAVAASLGATLAASLTLLATPSPVVALQVTNAYSLPASVIHEMKEQSRRTLMLIPIEGAVYAQVLSSHEKLLTDYRPINELLTQRNTSLGAEEDNAAALLRHLVATITTTPDQRAISSLRDIGISTIAVLNAPSVEYQNLVETIDQAPQVEPGPTTPALRTWRLTGAHATSQTPPATADDSHAQSTATRIWQLAVGASLLALLIGSLPRRLRARIRVDENLHYGEGDNNE